MLCLYYGIVSYSNNVNSCTNIVLQWICTIILKGNIIGIPSNLYNIGS